MYLKKHDADVTTSYDDGSLLTSAVSLIERSCVKTDMILKQNISETKEETVVVEPGKDLKKFRNIV